MDYEIVDRLHYSGSTGSGFRSIRWVAKVSNSHDPADEIEARIAQLKEEELVEYIRSTVDQLDTLADRLEDFIDAQKEDEGGTSEIILPPFETEE